MPFTHVLSKNLKTTTWSGGTTTELFIYPPTANYQQRDFDFRISTARVEVEQSDFTSLPGYSRKLMVLDGAVALKHEGHHSRKLNKFDIDEFEGEWKTTSVGRCTDFNLMTRQGINGNIFGQAMDRGRTHHFEMDQDVEMFFIYLYKGCLELTVNTKIAHMEKGDLVVLEKPKGQTLITKAVAYSEVVFTKINAKAL